VKEKKMATVTITKDNFEETVGKSEKPILVDFWAEWCGPCRMVGPVLEEISQEKETVVIGKLNVDEEQELAQEFGVMSIPTMILFKEGKAVSQIIGAQPKEALEEFIDNSILD